MDNKFVRAGLAGSVAGLVGAVLWAFIGAYIGVELAFVAWGIGGAVGFAVHVGVVRGELGPETGAVAVLCAILAIVGGKYLAVDWALDIEVEKAGISDLPSVEDTKFELAASMAVEREADGDELDWPRGGSLQAAQDPRDFPIDLWEESVGVWNAMTESEQDAVREEIRTGRMQRAEQLVGGLRMQAFKASFSPYDALWFLLALATAWRFGAATDEVA